MLPGRTLSAVPSKCKITKNAASSTGSHGSHIGQAIRVVALSRSRREMRAARVGSAGSVAVLIAALAHHGHGYADVGDAQAPDLAEVVVGNLTVEYSVAHLEEDLAGEQGIRASLVSRPDALNLESFRNILQARLVLKLLQDFSGARVGGGEHPIVVKLDGELHQVLHVICHGEIQLHLVVKVHLIVWKGCADEQLCEIAKVVATVEGYPSDVIEAYQTRRY